MGLSVSLCKWSWLPLISVDAVRGDAVAVVHGQGVEDVLPAGGLAGHVLPVLALLRRDEVEHLERGLLVGEVAAMTDGASEARVQRLDRVGGVDELAQL